MIHVKLPFWMLGLGLGLTAAMVSAPARGDAPAPGPSTLTPAPMVLQQQPLQGSAGGMSANVYDLAPAFARACYFDEQARRTSIELQMLVERFHKEYLLSDEYRAVSKKLADAKAAYEAAREPVLQSVAATNEYRQLIEKRTRVSIALQQPKLPMEDVVALAQRKMEYSAAASRMEADALNADASVRQTQADYVAAQAELNDKLAKNQLALYKTPEFVDAQKVYAFARDNAAGAHGFLNGALISRCDAVDADQRRYNGSTFVSPFIDTSYWSGYYGGGAIRPF